ncbi:MAG TPA: malonic semialdehyde reductase [Roseiarcus sp.]|jgi:3-hydroxypropanoate dehydrogenase|nr:malonic semialdehyde reductase [Roseiarcus sp.]
MTLHAVVEHSNAAISEAALAQIFIGARTHNGFLDKPVADDLLRQAVDIAKIGPTSANQSPMRVVFVKSRAAKERLKPALSPGNLDKTMAAPVTAITAYDVKFYEHLPFLMPRADAKSWFDKLPAEQVREVAHKNGTLQVAYLIIALRALGLDTGPMTGFDNEKLDAEFFPDGRFRSNVLINIGYGDHTKLFPRSPRFAFDEIAKIV